MIDFWDFIKNINLGKPYVKAPVIKSNINSSGGVGSSTYGPTFPSKPNNTITYVLLGAGALVVISMFRK